VGSPGTDARLGKITNQRSGSFYSVRLKLFIIRRALYSSRIPFPGAVSILPGTGDLKVWFMGSYLQALTTGDEQGLIGGGRKYRSRRGEAWPSLSPPFWHREGQYLSNNTRAIAIRV